MNLETYRIHRDAFDNMLDWAIDNNKSKRTQDEWDQLKADKLQEELDKVGLKITKLNKNELQKLSKISQGDKDSI